MWSKTMEACSLIERYVFRNKSSESEKEERMGANPSQRCDMDSTHENKRSDACDVPQCLCACKIALPSIRMIIHHAIHIRMGKVT